MSQIEWTPALSVGITEIDEQHKVLVKYVNDLHEAMSKGKGKDVTGPLLDGLVKYTTDHFAVEEKYFEQFNYPKTVQHIQEHRKLVAQVVDFKKQFDEGTVGLTIPLMDFLSNWLVNHIQGTDKQYTACFQEHGLS